MEINFEEIATSIATSTVILGAIIFIFKNIIINKITTSIKHKYDTRLAQLESALKNNNNEVNTLRNNILSGVNTRNKLLYEAKMNAVNELWKNVQNLKQNPLVLQIQLVVPKETYDNQQERIQFNRELFSKINLDDETISIKNATLVKPFISKYGWALFQAYSAIYILTYIQTKYLLIGTDGEIDFLSKLVSTVGEALPHQKEYLENNQLEGVSNLIPELENTLLDELQSMLDGTSDDEKHIDAIKKINELDISANELKRKADSFTRSTAPAVECLSDSK